MMREPSLVVNEIYASLQGESTWAGWPCVFVRLTGCPLRCSYCDTAFAFFEGRRRSEGEVFAEVMQCARAWEATGDARRLPLVELTGGEPLAQPAVLPFMSRVCDAGFTVLLETSGALDISSVDARVVRIMDLKSPSSGELERTKWDNLRHLRATDEIKFVLGTEADYVWMKQVIEEHDLTQRCPVLVSWAAPLLASQRHPSLKKAPEDSPRLELRTLAERVLNDGLAVRFQVQLHKVIWAADKRGV